VGHPTPGRMPSCCLKLCSRRPPERLRATISHELFHVLSRTNPELRDRLYAVIGFETCRELEIPAELRSRKITNPDAPRNQHCIRLEAAGKQEWAIPILLANSETYDRERGGQFFNYLELWFLVVERRGNGVDVMPVYEAARPKLLQLREVSRFFEQVGRNTNYIIHPEEILADNFALLVTGHAGPQVAADRPRLGGDLERGKLGYAGHTSHHCRSRLNGGRARRLKIVPAGEVLHSTLFRDAGFHSRRLLKNVLAIVQIVGVIAGEPEDQR